MNEEEKQELLKLIESQTQEAVYKQRTQALYTLMDDMMRKLPDSLKELEKALEHLTRNMGEDKVKVCTQIELMSVNIEKITKDLDILFAKIEETRSNFINGESKVKEYIYDNIVDQNNADSLIRQITKEFDNSNEMVLNRVLDKDNDKSIISIILGAINEIKNELKRNHTLRSIITWILMTIGTLIIILQGVFNLFGPK